MRKDRKWMNGLSSKIIKQILEHKPNKVKFDIIYGKYIHCVITTKEGVGLGIAICSILDKEEFDSKKGKNIAAHRALKSLLHKRGCAPIRTSDMLNDTKRFPRKWKKCQMKRVAEIGDEFGYKSKYFATAESIRIAGEGNL